MVMNMTQTNLFCLDGFPMMQDGNLVRGIASSYDGCYGMVIYGAGQAVGHGLILMGNESNYIGLLASDMRVVEQLAELAPEIQQAVIHKAPDVWLIRDDVEVFLGRDQETGKTTFQIKSPHPVFFVLSGCAYPAFGRHLNLYSGVILAMCSALNRYRCEKILASDLFITNDLPWFDQLLEGEFVRYLGADDRLLTELQSMAGSVAAAK